MGVRALPIRAEGGPAALADRLVEQLLPDRNYVIDYIRHPAEVEALRAHDPAFRLLWVDANEALRLERLQKRGRPGDPETLEEMRRLEGREQGGDDPAGQQLAAVRQLADVVLENAGSLAHLHAEVQRILERSLFFERPSWDEYFMSIARVVASRSNCVKRKVGAVIAMDRRIISTGYNGIPRGVRVPGGAIYTTFSPCLMCTKMIINAGLAEVIYNAEYPLGEVSLELLKEVGVKVRKVEG